MRSAPEAVLALAALLLALSIPAGAAAQYLDPDVPPELFELEQIYILPRGAFHGYVQAGAMPLLGDGDTEGPVRFGGKLGVHRSVQVELEVRDRLGTEGVEREVDPLDPFAELPPDTADDVRVRGGLRFALPAEPLDVISASAAFITSLRGEETVLLELTAGAAHRLGDEGPLLAGQVLHRRGVGSAEGPQGGDIQTTSVGATAMVRGGPLMWSLEGRFQVNSGDQPNAGRITPAAYWPGPVRLGLGAPLVVTSDDTQLGLSVSVGFDAGGER